MWVNVPCMLQQQNILVANLCSHVVSLVSACLQASALSMPEELCQMAGQQLQPGFTMSPAGLDQVQFLLGAGPGEPLRPLSAVASGGESARIMLALKAAPAAVSLTAHDNLVDAASQGISCC